MSAENNDNKTLDTVVLDDLLEKLHKTDDNDDDDDSYFNPINGISKDQVLLIKKNDNIKKKIDQVVRVLKSGGSQQQHILISAHSTGLQKLLAVLEIIKQKIQNKNDADFPDPLNYMVQYNKLDSIKSTQNPHHKKKGITSDNNKEEEVQTQLRPLKDDEPFTEAHLRELGIVKDKIYTVPILYVYLQISSSSSISSMSASRTEFTEKGWTYQDS